RACRSCIGAILARTLPAGQGPTCGAGLASLAAAMVAANVTRVMTASSGTGSPCLGVDCGGTRSRWAWSDAARAEGAGPGVQAAVQGVDAAAAALASVLQTAAPDGNVAACVAALAGAGDRALAQQLAAAVAARGIRYPLAVVGDVLAAAAGALGDGPG